MSRIASTFATLTQRSRKALIPFITAGDPDPDVTVALMHQLVQSGVDIIELGVPFSDPMADGPTIQRASERALKHHVGLRDVIGMVAEFREQNQTTPVVLMGYANPIEAMGYATFSETASKAGVDGVLVVDYPPEECAEWVQQLEKCGIDPIFLLSPTTPDTRLKQVAQFARGYVYYVSLKGVTGALHLDLDSVRNRLVHLRSYIDLPIGVGFGIRDEATARAIAQLADAVVVGSRIVEEIERTSRDNLLTVIENLVLSLRRAIDSADLDEVVTKVES